MSQYISRFDTSLKANFFLPKYWATWFSLGLLFVLSYCPIKLRDKFASWAASRLYPRKFLNKRKTVAFTNLTLCFPEYTMEQKDELMQKNFRSVVQIALSFGELAFRSKEFIFSRTNIQGYENIENSIKNNKSIIFVTPHCYAVDFLAVAGISAKGFPLSGMFKDYRNPIFAWFVTKYRKRFVQGLDTGTLYHRSEGLKPIIKGLRNQVHFLYLPDQDHGRENSIFAPFYNTQKASLPVLGRLTKLGKADVIFSYISYNENTSKYDIVFKKAIENFPTGDQYLDTCTMNKGIEEAINCDPSQYMWTLKILKTRPCEKEEIY